MEEQDLVFYKNKDGNIMSGGYLIKSMNNNLTQMVNSNEKHKDITDNQRGGGLPDILHNLAVPAGLLYLQQTFNTDNNVYENNNSNTKSTKNETYKKSNKVVEPSLYEKLVNMVSNNNKKNRKNKTRKNNNRKKQSKTKKRK